MGKTKCSAPKCSNEGPIVRGLCKLHYQRLRKYGSLELPKRVRATRACSVCERELYCGGLCVMHYQRLKKTGSLGSAEPSKAQKGSLIAWLRKNAPSQTNECLTDWPGARSEGRPVINYNGKLTAAARLMCEMVNGPPSFPRADSAHSCGNGHLGCLTPKHLSWKTRAANQADRVLHGTANRGERSASAKLTQSEVLLITKDKRSARVIAKERGVVQQTISDIKQGRTWGWLTGLGKQED